ncbi:glycosyl transferase [bacterium]|nr:glycosyl transferase [bacterium]MCI0602153.1 glycosyl transferase [bacterium]
MKDNPPPARYYFCTYFDHRYLPRGLALYHSLKKHCRSFELWILALDEECSRTLASLNLAEVHVVSIEELEGFDKELRECRKNRSLIEYYFTCTPAWLWYLFQKLDRADIITYLDADLFFFSDPAPLYRELTEGSIGIIAHRFPADLKHLELFGIYNVGWLSFRRDSNAEECLLWWRERCVEWCYDRPEEGRFADQKYLDDWPVRFRGVVVLKHKGANVAPWNVANVQLSENNGIFYSDSEPLLFYHFHMLKVLRPGLYDHGLSSYGIKLHKTLKRLYVLYLTELRKRTILSETGENRIRYSVANLKSSLLNRRILLLTGPIAWELNLGPVLRTVRRLRQFLAK